MIADAGTLTEIEQDALAEIANMGAVCPLRQDRNT